MAHLIHPLYRLAYREALNTLRDEHALLVQQACAALAGLLYAPERWGVGIKRATIVLPPTERNPKTGERLIEAVNMAATMERLLDALEWFSRQPDTRQLIVLVCHPSTSTGNGENDLILGEPDGRIKVRCEITDVTSTQAGQNGKEAKELRSLGCERVVPDDATRRFICTSSEFAAALSSASRKWNGRHYRYITTQIDGTDTWLLEIKGDCSAV